MTKEQAIELCDQIISGCSWAGLRAHYPKIKAPGTCEYVSTKNEQTMLWASLFREMAEALEPAMDRCAPNQVSVTFMSEGKEFDVKKVIEDTKQYGDA